MKPRLEFLLMLVLLNLLWQKNIQAQSRTVHGLTKSDDGKPISNAIITVKTISGNILGFNSTTDSGSFVIKIADSASNQPLTIYVNCLGYKKAKQPLILEKDEYLIILQPDIINLAEVKIKNRPNITSKRDTLSYDVSSFSQQQDRTIGDVLRRMPGIEIEENGQINYNGKPIYNLYIGSDDLLDGRYNLGTRTIPKDVIQSVEILQNFQPINVLKNKQHTDNVALNLVIKDAASLTLTGQATLGVGVPGQYDEALNTILFNKKIKMLNSLMFNNSGINYQDDIRQLSTANNLLSNSNTHPAQLLFSGTTGDPDLPPNRYYRNRSGMINLNNLYNLKNGLQLKSNVQILADRNLFDYNGYTNYFYQNDTLHYNESQSAVKKPMTINVVLKGTLNKDTYYLTNDLKFSYSNENDAAVMGMNGVFFNQNLSTVVKDFSNDLHYIPGLKNGNVIDVAWNLNYYNVPQRLDIDTGLNADVLNQHINYRSIQQDAEIPTWFSNASVAYTTVGRTIKSSYRFGVLNERQNLNSALYLIQSNNSVTPYGLDAGNNLNWSRNRVYAGAGYDIKKNNWEAVINFPIIAQTINYTDIGYQLNQDNNHVIFNPAGRIKYNTHDEDFLQVSYNYSQNLGSAAGIYRGVIVTNYRSIQDNDTELQEQKSLAIGLNYNFQRSLQLLFINAGVNFSQITLNSIPSIKLTDVLQQTILLPYNNNNNSINANFGISKYIFPLNATSSLKINWSETRFNQIINGNILPFQTNTLAFHGVVETKLFGCINLKYDFTDKFITSKQLGLNAIANEQVDRYDQALFLTYKALKNLFLTGKVRYISEKNENNPYVTYVFVDANLQYKIVKWKADLNIDLTNMANIRNYQTYNITFNTISYNNYVIRGRMAIFRLTFNL